MAEVVADDEFVVDGDRVPSLGLRLLDGDGGKDNESVVVSESVGSLLKVPVDEAPSESLRDAEVVQDDSLLGEDEVLSEALGDINQLIECDAEFVVLFDSEAEKLLLIVKDADSVTLSKFDNVLVRIVELDDE